MLPGAAKIAVTPRAALSNCPWGLPSLFSLLSFLSPLSLSQPKPKGKKGAKPPKIIKGKKAQFKTQPAAI